MVKSGITRTVPTNCTKGFIKKDASRATQNPSLKLTQVCSTKEGKANRRANPRNASRVQSRCQGHPLPDRKHSRRWCKDTVPYISFANAEGFPNEYFLPSPVHVRKAPSQ